MPLWELLSAPGPSPDTALLPAQLQAHGGFSGPPTSRAFTRRPPLLGNTCVLSFSSPADTAELQAQGFRKATPDPPPASASLFLFLGGMRTTDSTPFPTPGCLLPPADSAAGSEPQHSRGST